jgi:hypothetical protein
MPRHFLHITLDRNTVSEISLLHPTFFDDISYLFSNQVYILYVVLAAISWVSPFTDLRFYSVMGISGSGKSTVRL